MLSVFKKETEITIHIDAIANTPVITNWYQVENLCRMINSNDAGAKEAARALRKKLESGSPQQQLNVITMIQAMIDRCGSRFKAEMATSKFVQALSFTIWSGWTDIHVRARLIERLAVWAQACGGDPGLVSIQNLHRKVLDDRCLMQSVSASSPTNNPNSVVRPPMTREQRLSQIMSDVELADNNAHMLHEAVIFANPELEAVEENVLIKEFYSKCITLHRGMQIYLAEVVESSEPNEVCLASILSVNEELTRALTSYGQMMDRRQVVRTQAATRPSDIDTGAGVDPWVRVTSSPSMSHDLMTFAREGSPAKDNGKGAGSYEECSAAQDPSVASHTATTAESPFDPFADEPYYVSGPTETDLVSSAIRSGKQRAETAHGHHQEDGLSPQEREQLLRLLRDDAVVGSSSSGTELEASSSSSTGISATVSPVV
ncbi:putative actin patch assembly and actin polymerization protein [Gryganskiella cystojenkinii]|nr:putative actin patch assembly and actin polymerization protein [Gryganskiella cystojenkinii]